MFSRVDMEQVINTFMKVVDCRSGIPLHYPVSLPACIRSAKDQAEFKHESNRNSPTPKTPGNIAANFALLNCYSEGLFTLSRTSRCCLKSGQARRAE